MSNSMAGLSSEQIGHIRQLIAADRQDLIAAVQKATVEAIRDDQEAIIESVQKSIVDAITANQKAIITTLQNGNVEISSAPKTDSKKWQITMVVIQVVLTAILGYEVFNAQSRITERIDQSGKKLSTRLALTEEFYKRKLGVYERTYQQMTALIQSLQNARIDPRSTTQAIVELSQLHSSYKTNKLYLSDHVAEKLAELWQMGVNMPVLRPLGETTIEDFIAKSSEVEKLMQEDLLVEEIGQIRNVVNTNQSK